jgi:hypothetical protein
MQLLEVDPSLMYCFHQDYGGIPRSLAEHVVLHGWSDIPPIPVFTMPDFPEFMKAQEYEYLLIDGNKRRNVAHFVGHLLPIALYEFGENIDAARDDLAPCRHLNDPKVYVNIMAHYFRKNCP